MTADDVSGWKNGDVYGCPDPYSGDTRTLRQSVRSGRDSAMSEKSNFLVVIPTPIGVIALSMDALRKARGDAASLLDDPVSTRNQDDVAHLSMLLDAQAIAELFGIEATWFLTRAREGRIPHARFGKFVRFDPAEIRNYFRQNPNRLAN